MLHDDVYTHRVLLCALNRLWSPYSAYGSVFPDLISSALPRWLPLGLFCIQLLKLSNVHVPTCSYVAHWLHICLSKGIILFYIFSCCVESVSRHFFPPFSGIFLDIFVFLIITQTKWYIGSAVAECFTWDINMSFYNSRSYNQQPAFIVLVTLGFLTPFLPISWAFLAILVFLIAQTRWYYWRQCNQMLNLR